VSQRTHSLVLALSLAAGPLALADSDPRGWPVRFSEVYRYQRAQVGQIALSWDGLKAREFFLVLQGQSSFDATLTRDRDGSILYGGRRASHYEALIPWGQDEVAHLTLTGRRDEGIVITLSLATNPAQDGLVVYRFHVNRFLRLYEQKNLPKAKAALERAMEEDPSDSLAALLWRHLWRDEGLTAPPMKVWTEEQERLLWLRVAEGQRISQLRSQVQEALAAARPDSAQALLRAAGEFQTRPGQLGRSLLEGTVAIQAREFGAAIVALNDALGYADTPVDRFQAYRLLVAANRAIGNDAQARLIVELAIRDAPDPQTRSEAESWRGEGQP
jgi:tetratricopeptide (TPR) repeat protein